MLIDGLHPARDQGHLLQATAKQERTVSASSEKHDQPEPDAPPENPAWSMPLTFREITSLDTSLPLTSTVGKGSSMERPSRISAVHPHGYER